MSLAKDILRGVLWNHVGRVFEYALMYLFSVLVARSLGAEQNGTYVTFYTLAQLILLLSGLGFETALTRSAAQIPGPEDAPKLRYLFRTLIRWRVAALVIVVAAAYFLREEILHFLTLSDKGSQYLSLILLYAALKSLVPLFLVVFVAQLNTKVVSLISVSARALEVIAVFYLLGLGYGIVAVFGVIIGGAGVMLLGCLLFARRNYIGVSERHDPRPVIALGTIFWLNTIMAYLLEKQGDILLLNNLLADRREVAYYDVAYGVMQIVIYGFTVGFGGVSLAAFSRVAASSPDSLGRLWKFSAKIIMLLLLPPLIFLGIHAEVLIPRVYSLEYAASVGLFQAMVLFQISARLFGSGINADVLLAANKTKILVGFGFLAGILNIVLDVILIPYYRAYGAVIATGIANSAVMIGTAAYISRKFQVSVSVDFWLKVVLVSLLSGFVGKVLFQAEGLLEVLLSGVVYLILWILLALTLKLFSRDDIELIKRFNFQLSEWASHFALT